MFLPLLLSAPALACSVPGAELNSAGGADFFLVRAEKKIAPFGRDSAPPKKKFFPC